MTGVEVGQADAYVADDRGEWIPLGTTASGITVEHVADVFDLDADDRDLLEQMPSTWQAIVELEQTTLDRILAWLEAPHELDRPARVRAMRAWARRRGRRKGRP